MRRETSVLVETPAHFLEDLSSASHPGGKPFLKAVSRFSSALQDCGSDIEIYPGLGIRPGVLKCFELLFLENQQ